MPQVKNNSAFLNSFVQLALADSLSSMYNVFYYRVSFYLNSKAYHLQKEFHD